MKSDKELIGTLSGFDDYVNMVLEDVTELCVAAKGREVEGRRRCDKARGERGGRKRARERDEVFFSCLQRFPLLFSFPLSLLSSPAGRPCAESGDSSAPVGERDSPGFLRPRRLRARACAVSPPLTDLETLRASQPLATQRVASGPAPLAPPPSPRSETTASGVKKNKVKRMLLNGSNVAMVRVRPARTVAAPAAAAPWPRTCLTAACRLAAACAWRGRPWRRLGAARRAPGRRRTDLCGVWGEAEREEGVQARGQPAGGAPAAVQTAVV